MDSSTNQSAFEALPLLVLELICEEIARDDCGRRNLVAFSLASKRCCAVSDRQRFEKLTINVKDDYKEGDLKGKLNGDRLEYWWSLEIRNYEKHPILDELDRWDEILEAGNRWRHVRWITMQRQSYFVRVGNGDNVRGRAIINSKPPTSEERKQRNEAWLPLSLFISRLPGLRDLHWTCSDSVPLCVVLALQGNMSTRLHIDAFYLRSIVQYRDAFPGVVVDPDELALATSPNLHSITAVHSGRINALGRIDYNDEAVLQMVAGLAPNLKGVRMKYFKESPFVNRHRAKLEPLPPWQGLIPEADVTTPLIAPQGRLEALRLGMYTTTSLDTWNRYTQSTFLRTLELNDSVPLSCLLTLSQMADGDMLRSLNNLSLATICRSQGVDYRQIDGTICNVLSALRPLEVVRLSGCLGEKTFNALLHSHGRAVRTLKFIPGGEAIWTSKPYLLSVPDIKALAHHCPNITNIELVIPRTQGDIYEVQYYRALHHLQGLRHISLKLDSWHFYDLIQDLESYGTAQQTSRTAIEPRWIYHRLISAASDSDLALAIYRTISAGNQLLRQLQISSMIPIGHWAGPAADEAFMDMLEAISRSWLCQWEPNNEAGVSVKETGYQKGQKLSYWLPDSPDDVVGGFGRVWTELWPAREGEDWRDVWKSFPLDLSEAPVEGDGGGPSSS